MFYISGAIITEKTEQITWFKGKIAVLGNYKDVEALVDINLKLHLGYLG